jgi:hypothetical protein
MNLNCTGVLKNNMFSNLPAGEDEGQILIFFAFSQQDIQTLRTMSNFSASFLLKGNSTHITDS